MKRPWLWLIAFLALAVLFMVGTRQSKAAEKVTFTLVQAQAVSILDGRILAAREDIARMRQQQECIAEAVELRAMERCGPIRIRRAV